MEHVGLPPLPTPSGVSRMAAALCTCSMCFERCYSLPQLYPSELSDTIRGSSCVLCLQMTLFCTSQIAILVAHLAVLFGQMSVQSTSGLWTGTRHASELIQVLVKAPGERLARGMHCENSVQGSALSRLAK